MELTTADANRIIDAICMTEQGLLEELHRPLNPHGQAQADFLCCIDSHKPRKHITDSQRHGALDHAMALEKRIIE